MIKTQFHTIVHNMTSNNGGEYIYDVFQSQLKQKDILQQLSCAYTLEQSSAAKRKNRHIMFVAQCLLRGMHMAILTVVYLINRTPSRVLDGKAPFQVL